MASQQKARYGIAEWFGHDITKMTPSHRQAIAEIASAQDRHGNLSSAPVCPFLSSLVPGALCNKASGVCSIRKFDSGPGGVGVPIKGDKIVTVCPSRFLQPLKGKGSLFQWISEKMLDVSNPTVVKETPFLRKVLNLEDTFKADNENLDRACSQEEKSKKAGRIDWILVNPNTMNYYELEWCAVETQALYFSGSKMRLEFDAYSQMPSQVLFPIGKRRPDYRSSGPKRLSPQLDVKVPVLRNWGKKVVVVVDRFFYENMNALEDAFPRARDDIERRSNSEVTWFVVDFDDELNLSASNIVFTTLESSRRALNATEPLSKEEFTRVLKAVIGDNSRTHKVFKASE